MNFKKLVNMLRLGAPFRRGQEPELPGHSKQHGAAGVRPRGVEALRADQHVAFAVAAVVLVLSPALACTPLSEQKAATVVG